MKKEGRERVKWRKGKKGEIPLHREKRDVPQGLFSVFLVLGKERPKA